MRAQFIEQEPGPRGSPHDAAGAVGRSRIADDDLAGVLDCAANTDISFCRSAPLQPGSGRLAVARQVLEVMAAAAAFVFEKRHKVF